MEHQGERTEAARVGTGLAFVVMPNGFNPKTVYAWMRVREERPERPTGADIAAWEQTQQATAEQRALS